MFNKEYNQQPRKKQKLDTFRKKDCDEFGGQIEEDERNQPIQRYQKYQYQKNNQKSVLPSKEEVIHYQNILKDVVSQTNSHKYKKLGFNMKDLIKQENIKMQQQSTVKQKVKVQKVKAKKEQQVSSNWLKFRQGIIKNSQTKKEKRKRDDEFVAIDCEFVKCGQKQALARISIIGQNLQTIYDGYIRPQQKITDYVTPISGITYTHIKNAPKWQSQSKKIKKILLNKIIIGHTVEKDLQVCGLKEWKGAKSIIDIARTAVYMEGGKVHSLKSMTQQYLGKSIQQTWHSSVQDAVCTMELFLLRKKTILKQLKII